MCALTPHPISNIGRQPGEITVHDLHYEDPFACYTPREIDISYQSLGFASPQPELEIIDDHDDDDDLLQHYTILTGKDDASTSTRKLCHNAYERDRRKKLNDLYSSLRSLLPESDQSKKKKVSIPVTISRVLKYIPELQRQVERLLLRKEEMLSASSRSKEAQSCYVQSVVMYPMVSATCLNNRELMVQACLLNKDDTVSFSKIVRVLEREGLRLMNASTCTTQDDRCFCTLHLQAREAFNTECQIFCEHLTKEIREQTTAGSSIIGSM